MESGVANKLDSMNTESLRIARQLQLAYHGDAWHGPSLTEILAGVTAAQAVARPVPPAHSIWELVLHIEVWTREALGATQGTPMGKFFRTPQDWPPVNDSSESAWTAAKDRLFETANQLAAAIEAFDDARLHETVPGRKYDFYYLFHGVVQHSLYHGGQIALLKTGVSV